MNAKTLATLSLFAVLSQVSPVTAQVSAGGAAKPIPQANVQRFFQHHAAVAIPAKGLASTGPGKSGVWAAYNPATGRGVAVAGIGGSGTFTTATGASGPCAAVQGVILDPSAQGASGSLTYYQMNASFLDAVPTDTATANALYVKLFGPGALRPGESLTIFRAGPNGKAAALYWKGSYKLQWTTWYGLPVNTTVNVIKGVALVNGKLCAVFSAGSGSAWGKYAQ